MRAALLEHAPQIAAEGRQAGRQSRPIDRDDLPAVQLGQASLDGLQRRLERLELGEQRVRGATALHGVDQVAHARLQRRALLQERGALVRRRVGRVPLALAGLGDRARDQPLVDGLRERVQDGLVELLLTDHHIVLADHGAALVVIDAPVHRHATTRASRAMRPGHCDE